MALRYYTTYNALGAFASVASPPSSYPYIARPLRASTLAVSIVGAVITAKTKCEKWKDWTVTKCQGLALELLIHQLPLALVWYCFWPSLNLQKKNLISASCAHLSTLGFAGAYYWMCRPLPYAPLLKNVSNAALGFGVLMMSCLVDGLFAVRAY